MNRDINFFQQKAIYVSPTSGLSTSRELSPEPYTTYPTGTFSEYNVNNGILYFQNIIGGFVIPNFDNLSDILEENGYRKNSNLYVPCSNGDVPTYEREYWHHLLAEAEQERITNLINYYSKIASDTHISSLPDGFLQNCMEIPIHGVELMHWSGEKFMQYPHIKETYDESVDHIYIGTFCQNNGRISFVDKFGRTFVTVYNHGKTEEILKDAGYSECSLYVPLSNGETPVDSYLSAVWERICHLND